METAWQRLTNQDAEELRPDINGLLRQAHAPKPNLNKEERKVLSELKRDKDIIVLTADKGVAMVVLDKKEYKILRPLVGKSPHQIQSTKGFVNIVSKVTLLHRECLSSYDVTALLTSVPIDPALNILKELLEQDNTLFDRTVLSVQNIIEPLGFCLHITYISFQNKFYEQVEDIAMGSPVSPLVANLYMKNCEKKALCNASTPRHWF